VAYAAHAASVEIAVNSSVAFQRGLGLVHTALSTSALRQATAAVCGHVNTVIEINMGKNRTERRVPNPRRRIWRKPARTASTAQTTNEYNDTEGVVSTVLNVTKAT
jgi:hypothetical protein